LEGVEVEEAQVEQPQGTGGQVVRRVGGGLVGQAGGLGRQPPQAAGRQTQGGLEFHGGAAAVGGAAAPTRPGRGPGVGQGQYGAVADFHLGKAAQQRQGHGVGLHDIARGPSQQLLQELGRRGGEALVDGFGADRDAAAGGGGGQVAQGGAGIGQPAEDQGL